MPTDVIPGRPGCMAGVRRLDDKGYHLTPVRKAKGRRYELVGEPRQAQDGNYVDYDGLKIFEGDRMLLVTKGVILFLSNELARRLRHNLDPRADPHVRRSQVKPPVYILELLLAARITAS